MPSTGTPLEVSWEPETTTVPLLTNATSPGPGYPLAPAAEDHNNSSYQSPIPPNHDRVVMFPPTAACQGSDRGRRLANFGRIQRSNKYHRLWLVGSVLGFIPVRGSWRRTNSSVTAHSFSPAPSRRPECAKRPLLHSAHRRCGDQLRRKHGIEADSDGHPPASLDFSNAADIYSVNEAVSGCFQHAKAATRAYGGIFHLSRAMRVRRLCLSRHAGGRRHVSWLGRRCPGCLTWAAPTQS